LEFFLAVRQPLNLSVLSLPDHLPAEMAVLQSEEENSKHLENKGF